MKHRFATRDDVAQWFDGQVPATMRALVLEDGGKIIAIAGITSMGATAQAFSDVKNEARPHRVALARMSLAFRSMLDAVSVPVLALCNTDEPTSPGLLSHLGFRPYEGAVWRRR